MSDALHITRADDWVDSANAPISAEEFVRAATAEPRAIHLASLGCAPSPDEVPTFVWREEGWPSLSWMRGRVRVKGLRSDEEIGELARFARTLDARLIGDDGEQYDEQGPIDEA